MNTTDESPRGYADARALLRQHRGARTLKAFAEHCGIKSPSLIHEYEHGTRSPTFANALDIERGTSGVPGLAPVTVEMWGFDRATARRVSAAA